MTNQNPLNVIFTVLFLFALPCTVLADDTKDENVHKTYRANSSGWYSRVGSDKIKAETYNDARVLNYDWRGVRQIFRDELSEERLKMFGQDQIVIIMYINAVKKRVEKVVFIFRTMQKDCRAGELTDAEMYRIEERLRDMKFEISVIDHKKVPYFTQYHQGIYPSSLLREE